MSNMNIEEYPRAEVAEKVITEKRKYFSPGIGEVEAMDLEDAHKKLKRLKKPEVGDVNN